MKKILPLLFFVGVLFSCKTSLPTAFKYNNNLHTEINEVFTQHELDSVLIVEDVSTDLNDWLSAPFKDFETKEAYMKYLFIKENDSIRTTYILLYDKTGKYNLIKRVGK